LALPSDDQRFAAAVPHVKRLLDAVSERPAAQRTALLKDRHNFKTEMDDEARRAMFPHLAPAQA